MEKNEQKRCRTVQVMGIQAGRASFLPIVLSHLNTAFLQEARYSRASILPFPVIFGF